MNLILLSGPPASGKTTLRNRLIKSGTIISPDNYIGYNRSNPWTPKVAKFAWKKADELLLESLKRGDSIIVFDATLVNFKRRKKYIELGKKFGATVICMYCSASKHLILKRNDARDEFRKVPEVVMGRMIGSFVSPDKEEGFDFIVHYDSEYDRFDGDVKKVMDLIEGKYA